MCSDIPLEASYCSTASAGRKGGGLLAHFGHVIPTTWSFSRIYSECMHIYISKTIDLYDLRDLSCVQCFFFANLPPPKDLVTFNSAINACSKASQWQQALVLLSQLERRTGEEGRIDYWHGRTYRMVVPKSTATLLFILMLYATRNCLQTHTLLSPGNSRPTTSATTPRWMLALAAVIGEKRYTSWGHWGWCWRGDRCVPLSSSHFRCFMKASIKSELSSFAG